MSSSPKKINPFFIPESDSFLKSLIIADQIHYLGGIPAIKPKLVKTSDNTEGMLRFELENKNEIIATTGNGLASVKRQASTQ